MATQLFFRDVSSDYSTGNNDVRLKGTTSGWLPRALASTRGSSATTITTFTDAGPTNGVEIGVQTSALPNVWYSPPLDADVTISGSITWNLRAFESNMSANVAINGIIEVIDGATGTITLIDSTARTTELGTSEAAANFAETPAAGIACKRGDRLRVRVFGDDAGTMAAPHEFSLVVNGPTAGESGDSYLTLTENLTFASEPAGSQVFLTDTASSVSTASVDREAWTSRGGGVQTDVTNTAAGWAAPIQVTDTAGGTVVDWFTKPLTAFTLGGAVRCNIRLSSSSASSSTSERVEVAVVDTDGSNPVIWAVGSNNAVISVPEGTIQFLIAGDDLAVLDGKRLRIRIYIDDYARTPMASGHTNTLYYAGTSGGASGDTYLTFSQTLTEFVSSVTYNTSGQAQARIKQTYRGYAQAQASIKIVDIEGFGQAQAAIVTAFDRIRDTFTRTESTGWGTPDVGPPWNIIQGNSEASVNGSHGLFDTGGGFDGLLEAPLTLGDVEIDFEYSLTAYPPLDDAPQQFAFLLGHRFGNPGLILTDFVHIGFIVANSTGGSPGDVYIGIDVYTNGSNVDLPVVLIGNISTLNTEYRFKVKKIINGLVFHCFYKFYEVGDPEPDWSGLTLPFPDGGFAEVPSGFRLFVTGTDPSQTFKLNSLNIAPTNLAGYAQAQVEIASNSIRSFAQAQASIKQTYNSFSQAQASILQTYNVYAQAQALITQTTQQYSQAQALIYIPVFLRPEEDITTNNIVGVVI